MEISFRTLNNIQVVMISGAMGDAEAAAVRVKLEQKINQGRDRVLFDLVDCDIVNDPPRRYLISILVYCVNRGILVCCGGVQASQHPLLLLPGNKQIKIFFTLNEGLDYLAKEIVPVKGHPDGATKKTEEDLKTDALTNLLAKYEVFQQSDEDDPFRLKFLGEQYKANPNREAIAVEKKALEAFTLTQSEVQILDTECDQLGASLKSLMIYRKIPMSSKELQLKQETLEKEIDETKSAVDKIKEQVKQNKSLVLVFKQKALDTLTGLDLSIKDYEKKIVATNESYSREIENLKILDAQEQEDLEVKLKSKN